MSLEALLVTKPLGVTSKIPPAKPGDIYLYRIYKFDTKTMSAFLSIKKGPIERKYLQSINYVGRIGEKRNEI